MNPLREFELTSTGDGCLRTDANWPRASLAVHDLAYRRLRGAGGSRRLPGRTGYACHTLHNAATDSEGKIHAWL
jgi:hypothetical protein